MKNAGIHKQMMNNQQRKCAYFSIVFDFWLIRCTCIIAWPRCCIRSFSSSGIAWIFFAICAFVASVRLCSRRGNCFSASYIDARDGGAPMRGCISLTSGFFARSCSASFKYERTNSSITFAYSIPSVSTRLLSIQIRPANLRKSMRPLSSSKFYICPYGW